MTEDLAGRLREVYAELRARIRKEWSRDLPLDELLFDRWERARSLGFGNGTSVYHLAYFYGDVTIGRDCWIGPYTLIDGTGGGVDVGNHVVISAGTHIYTHDTVARTLTAGRAAVDKGRVIIGDCSYIGPQTIIGRNVVVGEHSVIGAGSFVNHDIPPFTVAAGRPCRPIGRVEIDGVEAKLIYDRPPKEAAP